MAEALGEGPAALPRHRAAQNGGRRPTASRSASDQQA